MRFASPRRLTAAIAMLLMAAGVGLAPGPASAAGTTNWVQFHFSPDLSGYNNFESILRPGNAGMLVLKWQTHIASQTNSDIESTPILADGRVFVATIGGATCYPGCKPERAYLYGLRATDGHILWRQPLGTAQVRSTAVWSRGIVYIGAGGALRAFRADTGKPMWATHLGGQSGTAVTLSRGLIYTRASEKLYAVSAADGSIKWSAQVGPHPPVGSIGSPVAAAGDRVYTVSNNGSLYAFGAETGAFLWKAGQGIGEEGGGVAVVDGKVYVAAGSAPGSNSVLEARKASNGALIWTAPATEDIHGTPAVGAGLVILGSVNAPDMRAYGASSGKELWSADVGGEVLGSPVLANGVVYVVTDVGALRALDSRSGVELFSWTATPTPTYSATINTPAVVNGMVYTAFGDGYVRGFGLP
jgi:eukaryotic-like serine/threonine-protein kinase